VYGAITLGFCWLGLRTFNSAVAGFKNLIAKQGSATVPLLPHIDYAMKHGKFAPINSTITLVGKNFLPGATVLVNNKQISDAKVLSANRLEFNLAVPSRGISKPSSVAIGVQLPDGTISNTITIFLNAFVMVVLGDSVAWGQGLLEDQKFYSLAGKKIKELIAVRENENVSIVRAVLAHSGAIIGAHEQRHLSRIYGEVPTAWPTIFQQIDEFQGPPEAVDLVLVCGGINDVGVQYILNPFRSRADIRNSTKRYCHDDMVKLLSKIAGKFRNPETRIVVTGYYQIVSDASNPELLKMVLGMFGIVGGIVSQALRDKLASNCNAFASQANQSLEQAVNEVNNESGTPRRLFLAVPSFQEHNAIFAPDPWLYGLNDDITPQDPVARERRDHCRAAGDRAPIYCPLASVGHPNVKGAQEYAKKIVPVALASLPSVNVSSSTPLTEGNIAKQLGNVSGGKQIIP
jgi:lysophospholipase L1-like esterase